MNQLSHAGYSNPDLRLVGHCYELAIDLFAGQFRPSGKPFLTHLIGTASILASLNAAATVVAGGLLHAAYTYGDFGNGRAGLSKATRKQVRCVIGAEAEELIARYAVLEWNEKTIPAIYRSMDELSEADRAVLLIRLANELEDHLDLGALYCADADRRRDYIQSCLYLCVEMAKILNSAELADALDRWFQATLTAEAPAFLRTRHGISFTGQQASPWYRFKTILGRWMTKGQMRKRIEHST